MSFINNKKFVSKFSKCVKQKGADSCKVTPVERLYCKRPIQCLASSKILTPTPSPPGEGVLGAGGGEDKLARGRGVGGSIVRKTPDTALYSIYVSTLWSHPCSNNRPLDLNKAAI
jgi:hypothetical protein